MATPESKLRHGEAFENLRKLGISSTRKNLPQVNFNAEDYANFLELMYGSEICQNAMPNDYTIHISCNG